MAYSVAEWKSRANVGTNKEDWAFGASCPVCWKPIADVDVVLAGDCCDHGYMSTDEECIQALGLPENIMENGDFVDIDEMADIVKLRF